LKDSLVILKLGGSVITDKSKPSTPNLRTIRRLASEVSRANVSPLILIHGGGSYGHPEAKAHRITGGLKEKKQLMGFSKTHEAMVSLNKLVVENLLNEGVPAFGMTPSSFIITEAGRIHFFEEAPLRQAVETGLIPVLYGDAVLDINQGFAILSGDQIAAYLAVKMNAKRLIMGVDVDGLFTGDPKKVSSASLIKRVTPAEIQSLRNKISKALVTDVTGGMLGKVSELVLPVSQGVQALMVNALKPDNVYKALRGEDVIGTRIEP
jgi:isopentenyl phosphate kinase